MKRHDEVIERVTEELEMCFGSKNFFVNKVEEWSKDEVGAQYEIRLPIVTQTNAESIVEALDRFDYWEIVGTRIRSPCVIVEAISSVVP